MQLSDFPSNIQFQVTQYLRMKDSLDLAYREMADCLSEVSRDNYRESLEDYLYAEDSLFIQLRRHGVDQAIEVGGRTLFWSRSWPYMLRVAEMTDHGLQEICPKCHGSRMVEQTTLGHTYWHECSRCHGIGMMTVSVLSTPKQVGDTHERHIARGA